MQHWKGDLSKPVVSVCCATYNHEPYIEDALEGFLIQETDFPFEILIHDDASTDKTADIIREYEANYPNLIKPIYQTENQYSKRNKPGKLNRERSKGKYIAFCEGDDYWIDPLKIKKQSLFLDNTGYSLCFTRFYTLIQKDNEFFKDKNQRYFQNQLSGVEFDFHKFYKGWHVGTQTLMYRKNVFILKNEQNPYYRDVFLFADLLDYGKGFCLQDFTAVYRIHDKGIYSGKSNFENSKISAEIYKEIYFAYRNNKYLKLKYIKFSNKYIYNLFKNKHFNNLFFEIKNRMKLFADIWLAYYTIINFFSIPIRFSKRFLRRMFKLCF